MEFIDQKKSVSRINKLKIVSNHDELFIVHKPSKHLLMINGKPYPIDLASKEQKRAVYWDVIKNELYEKKGPLIGARIKALNEQSTIKNSLKRFFYLFLNYF